MSDSANALQWDGSPGHYEVYYLSATDAASGVGLWIRYTMLAPQTSGQQPTCALWFMAMDPSSPDQPLFARKETMPASALHAGSAPFSLRVGDAVLDDAGMRGEIRDASWELRWQPRLSAYHHVHPLLRRARMAKTILTLPHADLQIGGSVSFGGRELVLEGARGGQAHLWGSKHASRWTWAHCNDLRRIDGGDAADAFVDGVSVFVPRLGRELGPSSPVVGRLLGDDFRSTSPARVLSNRSRFGLGGWQLEARARNRRIRMTVDAARELLVGVTYQDPDGELAYCYNSEVASMQVHVWDRSGRGPLGWALRESLAADGRAHFEYAQREPVPGVPLLIT